MAVFASRYAHALAEVAAARGLDIAAAQQQLRDFAGTYDGSAELREILNDPSVPKRQKLNVLDAISVRIGMLREVRNFIAVVMDHGHLDELGEILATYDEVEDAESGVAEAQITSARPVPPEDRASLEAAAAKLAGGKVKVEWLEDASLLGGAVVKIGSTVYDGSVKAQFARLMRQLVNA